MTTKWDTLNNGRMGKTDLQWGNPAISTEKLLLILTECGLGDCYEDDLKWARHSLITHVLTWDRVLDDKETALVQKAAELAKEAL